MKYLFLAVSAAIMVALILGAYSREHDITVPYLDSETTSENSGEAQPIKAEIINDDPAQFTIDVGFMANSGANTNAEFFAVYVSDEKPADCADFRDVDLAFEKPEKHHRRFNLSEHEDVIEAIDSKQCVIIPNSNNQRG